MTTLGPKAEEVIEQNTESIGKVGSAVSTAIHKAVLAGGEPTRKIADALHGTWLGHPLHPVLTDLTIGASALAIAFDAASAMTDNDRLRYAADRLVEAGLITAVPTAITGLTDYSTFPEWSASPATIHGVTNLINIGLYGWSIRERRRGSRSRGVLFLPLPSRSSGFSAWLGGALVYKYKVGVDHADRFGGPKSWTPVLAEDRLGQRQLIRVEFEGKPVVLYRAEGKVFAIGATCSHSGGPLDEGKIVDGHCVQCPWHDSVFDMNNGKIVHGPATQPQPSFEARIREDQVEIRLVHSTPPEE